MLTVRQVIFNPRAFLHKQVNFEGLLAEYDSTRGYAALVHDGARLPVDTGLLPDQDRTGATLNNPTSAQKGLQAALQRQVCFTGRVKKRQRRTFLEATEVLYL